MPGLKKRCISIIDGEKNLLIVVLIPFINDQYFSIDGDHWGHNDIA